MAKLASDHRKPNGQFVITPALGPAFVETLPVGKFHGIGPATSAKMNALGIHTGLDMRNQSLEFMQANFGKAGAYYYWISRGVDHREVRANRIRKSVGAENTFSSDLTEFDAMVAELQPLIDKVWRHCDDKGSRGRTVTLKIKFNDFEIVTRSRSVPVAVTSCSDLERLSIALLQNEMPIPKPVRLLGVLVVRAQRTAGRTTTRVADLRVRSMIGISRAGSMRSPVIVVGRLAFKFARDARGRASNLYEAKLYRTVNATRRALLCPVLWVSRNGIVQIMKAAKPLTDMMSLDEYMNVAEVWDKLPGEDSCPFEPKASDWGWFEGRMVALDYSTPAWESDGPSSA